MKGWSAMECAAMNSMVSVTAVSYGIWAKGFLRRSNGYGRNAIARFIPQQPCQRHFCVPSAARSPYGLDATHPAFLRACPGAAAICEAAGEGYGNRHPVDMKAWVIFGMYTA